MKIILQCTVVTNDKGTPHIGLINKFIFDVRD